MIKNIQPLKDYVGKIAAPEADKDMMYRLIAQLEAEMIHSYQQAREAVIRQDVYSEIANKMLQRICDSRGYQ